MPCLYCLFAFSTSEFMAVCCEVSPAVNSRFDKTTAMIMSHRENTWPLWVPM